MVYSAWIERQEGGGVACIILSYRRVRDSEIVPIRLTRDEPETPLERIYSWCRRRDRRQIGQRARNRRRIGNDGIADNVEPHYDSTDGHSWRRVGWRRS